MSTIAAHHYLSICHLRKQENIAISLPVLQRFDSAFFQTLPNVNVHPGVAVYHTLKIFSIVNAKDLLMPHTKFQVCTLKINTIFCHRKKKSHYFWTGVYIGYVIKTVFCSIHGIPVQEQCENGPHMSVRWWGTLAGNCHYWKWRLILQMQISCRFLYGTNWSPAANNGQWGPWSYPWNCMDTRDSTLWLM